MNSSLYIVAGPNGAGKTTFAGEFLPNYVECLEFVNADLIASGLSPFLPERAAIKAGRLMLERIHFLADRGTDFGFETTLSGKGYVRLLKDLKSRGYRICLYFLWVDNVDIALGRVADRVRRGGHNVPEKIIRRRFKRGLPNLFNLYRPFLDFWAIFDNSTDHPVMIACEEDGDLEVFDSVLFSKYGEAMKEEKLDKNLLNKSMAFRAEEALKKAVARTIADHKRTGDPIVIWRDGKVVKVPADQIEVHEPEAEYGNPKENGK